MNRRSLLRTLPAVTTILAVWPARIAAQDQEWVRGWERAQLDRPVRLASRARIAPASEPGPPLLVRGSLFARDGRTPAPGITVFAYHTDSRGLYDDPARGPHQWRLRGWAVTGADGRFVFDTIRPAPYPGRQNPAHIHMTIDGPGVPRRWTAEVLFADDELVTRAEREASARLGRFGGVREVTLREGIQEVAVALQIVDEGLF